MYLLAKGDEGERGSCMWASTVPVEQSSKRAAGKVASDSLVAVDEEPRVHRRPLPPPNVERANALASKEVITLRSSLAVSSESRVECRSYCVSQKGSQVKLRPGLSVHGNKDEKTNHGETQQLHPQLCSRRLLDNYWLFPSPATSAVFTTLNFR